MLKKVSAFILIIALGVNTLEVQAKVVFSTEEDGIHGQTFYIDSGDTSDDFIDLEFGQAIDARLRYDVINDEFEINRDTDFSGNEIKDVRVENLGSAPACDAANRGKIYYNTSNTNSYICNGTTWEQIDAIAESLAPFVTNSAIEIPPSTTQVISITGTGFSPSSTVSLLGFPGTINSTTVISPTQIDVSITSTAAFGTYDLVVDNGGLDNTVWPGNGVDLLEVSLVTGTGPAGTYTESFETDFGNWTDSGLDVAWLRDSAGTPSTGTGPTVASVGTFYVFTEASSPNFPSKTFGFESTHFNVAQSVSFDYHMFGADMGDLEVQTLRSGVWTTRFTVSGNQQTNQADAYLSQFVDLSSFQVEAIRFQYTSGANFTGDCAVDNVQIISS